MMLGKKKMPKVEHKTGSDNVFADLGIPEAQEYLAKADVARKIIEMINSRGLTQSGAARVLRIDQPKVSALMRGILTGFSMDRLVRFVSLLGATIEISIKHQGQQPVRRLGVYRPLHEHTNYMLIFSPGSINARQYPIQTSCRAEDWRVAPALNARQNTFNQALILNRVSGS